MFDKNIKFKYSWRPYQAKVLSEVDKYLDDGRINIVAAPGSGKTVLGLELARKLGNPVLILSPTITIKNQWIDRFVTLFMPEGSKKPDWISSSVYELSYFNSITYQGLHCSYKKRAQKNYDETDDEVLEEFEQCDDIDNYDLIKEIKKNNIKTIILDEAHHLKSEWWQSLTKVLDSLEGITIVSLTATPPYDVEYNEWKRYTTLCGDIDLEISVPELVAAKNLCPHQDYIYFSYPTENEKNMIDLYQKNVRDFIISIQHNQSFINLLQNHKYIKDTESYVEEILDNAPFYSSMLIFLNSINQIVDKEKVEILGHNKPIPNLTSEWVETLLQELLFDNDEEYFTNNHEVLEKIKHELNSFGAVEKRKVLLSQNSSIEKYFVSSISKLESINRIVESEFNNLKSDLRMVILTDFLRKEYLFEENIEMNKIGVFPIFINLLNKNPNLQMAILTGSIFAIPISQKENLITEAMNLGIENEFVNFIPIEKVPSYCIVKTTEARKNKLMNAISKLFSNGNINIIIGTKSLLGEGWDEPSINSLILASFVGSYVLSNQMRGRAIRTNSNPYKTANVWHLVCASEIDKATIENPDFEMLKRRFKSFVGIGYNIDVLENGIDRLDLIPKNFSKSNIDNYNKKILDLSNDRTRMYNKWFKLINLYKNVTMSNQLQTKKETLNNTLNFINVKNYLKVFFIFLVIILLLYVISSFLKTSILFPNILLLSILSLPFLYIIGVIFNIDFIVRISKAIKYSISKKNLKSVAKLTIKSLCHTNFIKTNYNNIDVRVYEQARTDYISLSITGVTTHENNLIIKSIKEIFSNIENQRYILVSKKKKLSTYYNVPEVLSTKKELAEIFYKYWQKHFGHSKLYYTRNTEGRSILYKARKNNFDYTSFEKFVEKKKTISDWK